MSILTFILSILFPLAFAIRNSYQWRELMAVAKFENKPNNRLWHIWQAVVQVIFFVTIGMTKDQPLDILFSTLMSASVFWLVFDLVLNKGTKKPLLYYSDSGIDKIMKKLGPGALIIKLILVVVFTTWHFKNPF